MKPEPWLVRTKISQAHHGKFNKHLTDKDQGNFEFKMMVQ